MINKRLSNHRGHFNYGWLETFHTFSFASYFDPDHTGYRTLRVINEDRIQPGEGFDTHPHANMEIISYVISGSLGHKDSMDNEIVLEAGDVQVMTAGTGITHSEYNRSQKLQTHFLQIWIRPERIHLEPRFDHRSFTAEDRQNQLQLIVSGDGRDNSLLIMQDADIYSTALERNRSVEYEARDNRGLWIQVLNGTLRMNDAILRIGDGASVEGNGKILKFIALEDSEFLLFDLA